MTTVLSWRSFAENIQNKRRSGKSNPDEETLRGTLAIALSAGGLIVIAYGAVFAGAGMWLKAYPQLKRYPDRPMPKYIPPRDARVHDPMNY
jgi:hypothetical protein